MTMTYRAVASDEVLASLSAERQARIKTRAKELIAEEAAPRDLRRARRATQDQVAEPDRPGRRRT
jgi:hypothetical protein